MKTIILSFIFCILSIAVCKAVNYTAYSKKHIVFINSIQVTETMRIVQDKNIDSNKVKTPNKKEKNKKDQVASEKPITDNFPTLKVFIDGFDKIVRGLTRVFTGND